VCKAAYGLKKPKNKQTISKADNNWLRRSIQKTAF